MRQGSEKDEVGAIFGAPRYVLPKPRTLELLTAEVQRGATRCNAVQRGATVFNTKRRTPLTASCSLLCWFCDPQATWPSSVTGGFVIPFQGQARQDSDTLTPYGTNAPHHCAVSRKSARIVPRRVSCAKASATRSFNGNVYLCVSFCVVFFSFL